MFPGTNCEYDSARAVLQAGLEPEIVVLNNQSAAGVADSAARFAKAARQSQIIFLPGGFSGGDEPDGSGNSSPPSSAIRRYPTPSWTC